MRLIKSWFGPQQTEQNSIYKITITSFGTVQEQ